MHFSIPDAQELNGSGISYTVYNLHVNGVFHCSVRYRQFYSLYERLKKEFPKISANLPRFPPKKLLPLSLSQLEERRVHLEKFIQGVGQEVAISDSQLFRDFLLNAQQVTNGIASKSSTIDVYLTNGLQITLDVHTDHTSDYVLWKACEKLGLPRDLCNYFCLFLEKIDDDGELTLKRKLLDFESPFISLASLSSPHRIVIRKSYWDSNIDLLLMENKVALNLLYLQAVCDMEKGWVVCSSEHRNTLSTLQSQGAKKQYLELARSLKFYGYLQFKPCTCDYPYEGSRVVVAAGNKELNLRVRLTADDDIRQGSFKVTRMRCWRITTQHGDENGAPPSLELSFEYLIGKDKLQWITIYSEEAVMMSMCLQSMVEQLLDETAAKNSKSSDTSSSSETTPSTSSTRDFVSGAQKVRRNSKHSVSFNPARGMVRNQCFDNDGIGDDDL